MPSKLYDLVHQLIGGEIPADVRTVLPTLTDLGGSPPNGIPPMSWAYVGPSVVEERPSWSSGIRNVFDITIYAALDAAPNNDVSNLDLLAGVPRVTTIAGIPDDVIESVDTGTEQLTLTAHGYNTGDGPFTVENAGGALPAGIMADTDYWIRVIDDDNVVLHESFRDAMTLATPLDIASAGSGTNTITFKTDSTSRVYWHLIGEVSQDLRNDVGAAVVERAEHYPPTVAYSITSQNIQGATLAATFQLVRNNTT